MIVVRNGLFHPTSEKNGMNGIRAQGIQSGPFGVLLAQFVLEMFHLSHLYSGRPFLITPKG